MDFSGKRFLVIGGAGFIGSHVVDALTRTNASEIVIYDNFCRGKRENLANALKDPRVSIFGLGGDILQTDILAKAMEGVDGVFHLAALWLLHCHDYPRSAFEVNIRGTFNVIEAAIAARVKRVVYSSSASVYGNALQIPMTEDHPFNNDTFYGATKIAGEQMFKSLGGRYSLDWVGLRYMNVYGPRQDCRGVYTAVIHKVLDRIEQNQSPIVYGDGSQCYDFIEVTDIARANLCAMQAAISGRCYNVGTGIGTSIKKLTERLMQLTNCDNPIEYLPQGQTFVTNRIGATEQAETDLGFRFSVPLDRGLQDLIDWRLRKQPVDVAVV
jgi:UDP-glucose 4-epimerase